MKNGFTPIQLDEYVKRHLDANPDVDRADLIERLHKAVDAAKRGERCSCGAPIWIVGSAEAGLSCFTCITGEAVPDNDFEIDLRRSRVTLLPLKKSEQEVSGGGKKPPG